MFCLFDNVATAVCIVSNKDTKCEPVTIMYVVDVKIELTKILAHSCYINHVGLFNEMWWWFVYFETTIQANSDFNAVLVSMLVPLPVFCWIFILVILKILQPSVIEKWFFYVNIFIARVCATRGSYATSRCHAWRRQSIGLWSCTRTTGQSPLRWPTTLVLINKHHFKPQNKLQLYS